MEIVLEEQAPNKAGKPGISFKTHLKNPTGRQACQDFHAKRGWHKACIDHEIPGFSQKNETNTDLNTGVSARTTGKKKQGLKRRLERRLHRFSEEDRANFKPLPAMDGGCFLS